MCIQMCLSPQDSCTLYIPVERRNVIQPTIIRNLFIPTVLSSNPYRCDLSKNKLQSTYIARLYPAGAAHGEVLNYK
jgi:hypothetical protein